MFAMLMGLKSISPSALHARMQAEAVTIFDLNSLQSWGRARVPGARHLPVEFTAEALPADRATSLVFYCSNPLCRKAPGAARKARALGYSDVCVLSAGISGWLGAGLPVHGE